MRPPPFPEAARDAERRAATNAWAFLRLLAPRERPARTDWAALSAAVARDPAAARAGFAAMAGIAPDSLLLPACARLLLHCDLRPDDVLALAGVAEVPWREAARWGTRIVTMPESGMGIAAEASVLAAPVRALTGFTPDPAALPRPLPRLVIALGAGLTRAALARLRAAWGMDCLVLGATRARFLGTPL
ncbi:MAG: hypothetical protein KGI51_07685, partial [Rhodospirillales bacterium]|nr:hypothetical protein [Rhodospirillales bacterium]